MQFVNPLFLFALAALAIPILVHLFNFRQYRKVFFTNVNFLKEIQQETKKQSRLKQLLILLSRLLAVACLVFAFAQPYIPNEQQSRKITAKKAVTIYIDNSFSMEAMGTEGRLLDQARARALDIASAYAPSDLFQLMTNDFEGSMQRFTDIGQFRKMVEEVQISPVSRSHSDVMKRQADLVTEAAGAAIDAYLVSDFQKSTSPIASVRPDTSLRWFLVPLSTSRPANLYIDTVYFQSPVHQPEQPVKLLVVIRNISDDVLEKIPVKLTINGIQKAVANFAISPGGTTTVVLPYTENQPGIQSGLVEISDYPIVIDDKFYFSYTVQPAIRVTGIFNKSEDPYLDALFGSDSSVVYSAVPVTQVSYSNLFSQAMIILESQEEISSGLAGELNRFVRLGGHLAIFPPTGKSNGYDQLLSQFGNISLGPVDTNRQRITRITLESDLFSDVFERNSAGQIRLPDNIDLPMVRRHYRLQGTFGDQAENLLLLQNNDPFLISINVEKGKIYLFSSPPDPAWSDFPRHVIFVPTMYKMVLLSTPVQPLFFPAGENATITIPADSAGDQSIFRIRHNESAFEMIPGIKKTGTSIALLTHDQIKNAGSYQIYSGDKVVSGVSFNYDRRESDLDCYTADELVTLVKQNPGKEIRVISSKKNTIARQIHEINQGTPLWKLFILLTLLFIGAEIALIRFFKG